MKEKTLTLTTEKEYRQKRQLMIDYLLLKVAEGDWHGVADAAMDLREIEVRAKCSNLYIDDRDR